MNMKLKEETLSWISELRQRLLWIQSLSHNKHAEQLKLINLLFDIDIFTKALIHIRTETIRIEDSFKKGFLDSINILETELQKIKINNVKLSQLSELIAYCKMAPYDFTMVREVQAIITEKEVGELFGDRLDTLANIDQQLEFLHILNTISPSSTLFSYNLLTDMENLALFGSESAAFPYMETVSKAYEKNKYDFFDYSYNNILNFIFEFNVLGRSLTDSLHESNLIKVPNNIIPFQYKNNSLDLGEFGSLYFDPSKQSNKKPQGSDSEVYLMGELLAALAKNHFEKISFDDVSNTFNLRTFWTYISTLNNRFKNGYLKTKELKVYLILEKQINSEKSHPAFTLKWKD